MNSIRMNGFEPFVPNYTSFAADYNDLVGEMTGGKDKGGKGNGKGRDTLVSKMLNLYPEMGNVVVKKGKGRGKKGKIGGGMRERSYSTGDMVWGERMEIDEGR